MATASVSAPTPPPASPTLSITHPPPQAAPMTPMEETATEAKVITNSENEKEDSGSKDPLSSDLRRILTEVAQTGSCGWLSWNGDDVEIQAGRPTLESRSLASTAAASRPSVASTGNRQLLAQLRGASSSSSYRAATPASTSRKKHRNGLHVNRRRYSSDNGTTRTITIGGLPNGRKRPIYLTRTPSSSTASVAGSIGSGRTSGSEPDDSTQYEWDSEGTSATSNSEISLGERREQRRRLAALQVSSTSPLTPQSSIPLTSDVEYKTLREAFRVALGYVLDHYYHHRGYKLSPVEIGINKAAVAALKAEVAENGVDPADKSIHERFAKLPVPSAETTFSQRRKRLLARFDGDGHTSSVGKTGVGLSGQKPAGVDGPPFTVQRIAEVLIAPERYYTQTHKLCNCLEKLELVTSPASAFGGIMGGSSSQSRRENRESSALAEERGRLDAEHRSRRLRRRMSSSSDEASMDVDRKVAAKRSSPEKIKSTVGKTSETMKGTSPSGGENSDASGATREQLEAAARASLRHKFDHIGHDPHGAVDRDARGPNRGITTSPPPPSLGVVGPATMPGHNFVRHLSDHSPPGVGESSPEAHGHGHSHIPRPPSPILFSGSDPGSPTNAGLHLNHNMHLLQMHHSAVAGVPLGSAPRNIVIDPATGSGRPATGDPADAEMERSSASNSDHDSESDDFSLDDSASDRSDGSDSGSGTPSHYEPFTAARVMALNRMQQQQRLQLSRTGGLAGGLHLGDGYRPPADSEYQSGDSMDSTLAEDSCGSDSSSVSSDIAD